MTESKQVTQAWTETPSLFPVPVDDTLKTLADFIYKYSGRPHVEIEGRLGLLWQQTTDKRYSLAEARVCVPLSRKPADVVFQSSVPQELFDGICDQLKKRHNKSVTRSEHIDLMYAGNIRVTTNKDDTAVLKIVRKTRLDQIDFTNPSGTVDFRVSACIEEPWNETPNQKQLRSIRKKERQSYDYGFGTLDVTMVHDCDLDNPHGTPLSSTCEIELELSSSLVAEQRKKASERKPNDMLKLARRLIEELRAMATLSFASSSAAASMASAAKRLKVEQ